MSLFVIIAIYPTAAVQRLDIFGGRLPGIRARRWRMLERSSYKVFAISADNTQWEMSQAITTRYRCLCSNDGAYNSSGTGTATGQSGAGTKINFIAAPTVAIIAMAEDLRIAPTVQNFITKRNLYDPRRCTAFASGCRRWRRGGGGGTVHVTSGTAGGFTTFGAAF